jgi:trehalose 6-phosphate synthase/phosphatase
VGPGSFIERKKIALTWHYRRADPEYGAYQARECQKQLERTVAKKHDVEVMTGKANLEVRPRFVNKGEIAKRLVLDYGDQPGEAPEFVFCLGDDFTDEGMYLVSTSAEQESDDCRHVPLIATVEAPGGSRVFRHGWR